MLYVVTQQFEKFAHQHPAQECGEAQHPCLVTPSYRACAIEIWEQAIPDKCPLQQCRLMDGVGAPWLLPALIISFQ